MLRSICTSLTLAWAASTFWETSATVRSFFSPAPAFPNRIVKQRMLKNSLWPPTDDCRRTTVVLFEFFIQGFLFFLKIIPRPTGCGGEYFPGFVSVRRAHHAPHFHVVQK